MILFLPIAPELNYRHQNLSKKQLLEFSKKA